MRRRQDEDSSLELLLDTMCNTFGGVMFIAISLAVMLSMRGAVERVTADESAEILKTRQQITVLQQQIEAFQKEQKAAEEIINSSAADPLIRLAQEVVILEQMLEIRKLRLTTPAEHEYLQDNQGMYKYHYPLLRI